MSWLIYALSAICVLVFSVYVDKFLLSKYFAGKSPGVLILFSSLFAVIVAPVLYLLAPQALSVGATSAVWLLLGGVLNISGTICYLYAVNQDDASAVVPLFQLNPVFALILGWTFLGETLSIAQLTGFLLVFFGVLVVSFDIRGGEMKLRKGVILLMVAATLFFSTNTIIFKSIALEQSFLPSMFWEYTALVLVGLLLFTFVGSYRRQFLSLFEQGAVSIISLNILNEITGVLGYMLISYASLLAPVALVAVVGGTQPFFLFVFGALFTLLAPKFIKENLARHVVIQKLVAAVIIFSGIYLMR